MAALYLITATVLALQWLAADTWFAPRPAGCDVVHLVSEDGSSSRFRLEAVVTEAMRPTRSGGRMAVEAVSVREGDGEVRPVCGRVLVHVRRLSEAWRPGRHIRLTTRLRSITNFGNPGEFDWAGWNARRGRFASAFVWDGAEIEAVDDAGPEHVRLGRLARIREQVASLLAVHEGRNGQAAALVLAFLVGDRSRITLQTTPVMRDAGLAHVLAISGMHMGMFGGSLFALVSWLAGRSPGLLRRYDKKRVAALAASVGLLCYGLLALPSVSVNRALVMSLLYMFTVWRGTAASSALALALAALVCALLAPGSVTEVGFQLSFTAVGSLIVYSSLCARVTAGRSVWSRRVAELAGAVVVCWLVTMPLLAQHFGRVSLVAPMVNLLCTPLVGLALLSSAAGVLLTPLLPPLGGPLLAIGVGAARAVIWVADRAASVPQAALDLPAPGWGLTVSLIGLVLAAMMRPDRRRVFVAVAAISVFLFAAAAYHDRYRDDRLDVVVVSVGHGDATVVRLPGGSTMLVDGGGPGRGRIAVAPLLRRMHIGRLDLVVVTHVHRDHWGGLQDLLGPDDGRSAIEVGELWYPAGDCDSAGFAGLLADLAGRGTALRAVGSAPASPVTFAGSTAPWRVEALWPLDDSGPCDSNDRSVVLWIEHGGHAVILAGDIEAAAEKGVISRWRERGLGRPLVLKVPHHGSRSSSSEDFVAALAPRLGVVSSARGRLYGLPDDEVVDRYRAHGIRLMMTATEGAVRFHLERSGLRLERAGPR